MAAPSQRDVINEMQVKLAGIDVKMEYLKQQADSTDRKLDLAIESIGNLAFAPLKDFQALEARVKQLEDNNAKNSLGLKFSNDLAKNIWNFLLVAVAAGLLWLAVNYLHTNGSGR